MTKPANSAGPKEACPSKFVESNGELGHVADSPSVPVPSRARVVQALVLQAGLAGNLLQRVLDAPQIEVGAVVAVHKNSLGPKPTKPGSWESVHVGSQKDFVVGQEVGGRPNEALLAVHIFVVTRLSVCYSWKDYFQSSILILSKKSRTYVGLVKAFAGPVELGRELRSDKSALVRNIGHHRGVSHHHNVKSFSRLVQPRELPSFQPPVQLLFS